MALTKEQILTLTCLKEVDVKGVGPQKKKTETVTTVTLLQAIIL